MFADQASPALVIVATVLFVAALAITVFRVVVIRRFRRQGPKVEFTPLADAPKPAADATVVEGLVQASASIRGIRKGELRVDRTRALLVIGDVAVVVERKDVDAVRFVKASVVPPVGIVFDTADHRFGRVGFRADEDEIATALTSLRERGWPVHD